MLNPCSFTFLNILRLESMLATLQHDKHPRELWGTCWWFKPGLIRNSCWLQALPTSQAPLLSAVAFVAELAKANVSQPKHQPPTCLRSRTTWARLSACWGWAEPVGRAAADIAWRHCWAARAAAAGRRWRTVLPVTIPSHHSGASMMDRGVPSLGRKKKKKKKGCLKLLSSPSTVVPPDPALKLASHPSSSSSRAVIPQLRNEGYHLPS